jgi:hypothetical protein
VGGRVTWLLPVKNGMPYITETLASIGAQTYRDWEVLAWDNGSTDGTADELRRWIPSRLPGRVVADEPLSLGVSLARLVEQAPTELCARIDADDVNLPGRLSEQVAFLSARPEVGAVGTWVEHIDEQGRVRPCPEAWNLPTEDAELRWHARWATPLHHPTVMFRRSVVLDAGNYADRMPYEDHDLWLRVALVAGLANIPRPLVRYRVHSASVTARASGAGRAGQHPVAALHAGSLFGDTEAGAALELRDKVQGQTAGRVRLSDVAELRRAAGRAAVASGLPPGYFRSTRLYAAQRRTLLGKWLRQSAPGRLLLASKRAAAGGTLSR